MKYWLVKTEPSDWSWQDQVRQGIEPWTGVRNYQASSFMKNMAIGDLAFFYHTGQERKIVGIVRVVRTYYPDFTDPAGTFGMVDMETVEPLQHPVSLVQIKNDPCFSHLHLVRQGRLSVMPIDDLSWARILKLGSGS